MTRLAAMASLEEVLSTVGWTPVIRRPPNAPGPWALGPDLEKARQGKAVFNLGAMC